MVKCINGDFSLQDDRSVFYQVSFNYYFSFIVRMDEKDLIRTNPQAILDVLADALEERQYDGVFVEEEDLPYTDESEYVECGNNSLKLDTHSILMIKEINNADLFLGVEVEHKGKRMIVSNQRNDRTIDLVDETNEKTLYNVPLDDIRVIEDGDGID